MYFYAIVFKFSNSSWRRMTWPAVLSSSTTTREYYRKGDTVEYLKHPQAQWQYQKIQFHFLWMFVKVLRWHYPRCHHAGVTNRSQAHLPNTSFSKRLRFVRDVVVNSSSILLTAVSYFLNLIRYFLSPLAKKAWEASRRMAYDARRS